ncbi:hypothetical protein JCM30760_04120 [Thiomicrorhabdus hydrogeniphila]
MDDNEVLRRIQIPIISSYGHNVIATEGCREAMELLSKQDFDVILMDMVMPEVDGLECTKNLKEQGVSVPIVSLSSNDSLSF